MKTPHPQLTKIQTLGKRRKILGLISSGVPKGEVAKQMGLTVRSVARHLAKVIETESNFPATLRTDEVHQLRHQQAAGLERHQRSLDTARERCVELLKSLDAEIATEAAKALSSIAKSYCATSAEISRLFGTYVPQTFMSKQLIEIEAFTDRNTHKICFNTQDAITEIMAGVEDDASLRDMKIWEGQQEEGQPSALPEGI